MKVNCALFSIILICVYISGCTRLAFELNQEMGREGTININIHTDADPKSNSNINVFIDNVRVDMDALKSLVREKKKTKKSEPFYQIYGTF